MPTIENVTNAVAINADYCWPEGSSGPDGQGGADGYPDVCSPWEG